MIRSIPWLDRTGLISQDPFLLPYHMMKYNIRWLTLVEMIIVIVIVSIMLLITLNISSNQTQDLRFRIAKEAFVSNYNSFIIKAITTNNTWMMLIFNQNNGDILSATGWSIVFEPHGNITLQSFNNINDFDHIYLSFDPIKWSCLVKDEADNTLVIAWPYIPIIISYSPRPNKTTCYAIYLTTCKLKQCPIN